MKDFLFEYEAVIDGAEAGAAEPAPGEAAGAVQPDAVPDTTPEAVVEAAPAWAPSQDDWQTLSQRLDQLQQAVTPQAAAPAEPQLADYFQQDADGTLLIDPASLQKYIDDQVTRGVSQRIDPLEPVLNQTVQERGEQIVQAELQRLKGTVGDFDLGLAKSIAEGLVQTSRDPAAALAQAARVAHEHDKQVAAAAVEAYKQTLGNIAHAPAEPGAAGAALDRPTPRPGLDGYRDVADRWAERNGFAS